MTEYLTNDQISYIVHGYQKRTMSHSIFLIKIILSEHFGYRVNLILKLKFRDRKTYKQIGDILDISAVRVGQILHTTYHTIKYMYPRYKRKYLT